MTKGELIQHLAGVPDDFQLNFSKYLLLKPEGSAADEAAVVMNDPIIGVAVSDQAREIRFVRDGSNLDFYQEAGDKLVLLDGPVK